MKNAAFENADRDVSIDNTNDDFDDTDAAHDALTMVVVLIINIIMLIIVVKQKTGNHDRDVL